MSVDNIVRNPNMSTPVTRALLEPEKQRGSMAGNGMIPTIDDFSFIKPISRGAFGKVFLGHKKNRPNKLFAIKVMKKADMVNKNMMDQVVAERDTLAVVKSPFVVRLYYSLQTELYIYLVMEYMIGGDLKSLLSVCGYFDEDMAIVYTAEVTLALEYLHSHGIVHRDVKPDNMLISHKGHIKLTDFGLSKINLNRQIKIDDILSTPLPMGGNRLKKEYFRTPGQVLSLTSHFAFNSNEKVRKNHGPMLSTSSCGNLSRSRHVNMSPAPVKGLTPTLENSRDMMSPFPPQTPVSKNEAVAPKTEPKLRQKISWDCELDDSDEEEVEHGLTSPTNASPVVKSDIEETPQLNITRSKGRLRSFAAEKMRGVRTGSDSMASKSDSCIDHERKSLQSMLNACDSDESETEGKVRKSSARSSIGDGGHGVGTSVKSSLSDECDDHYTQRSEKMNFGDSRNLSPPRLRDLSETPAGTGGSKRSFCAVMKSPLGKSSSWHALGRSVNQSTGLTAEITGLKLGDEHRIKRHHSIPMECDENGNRDIRRVQNQNSTVGSDSVFLNSTSEIPDSEIEIFRTGDIFGVHDIAQPGFSISSIGSASTAGHSLLRESHLTSFHTPENFIIPNNSEYDNSCVTSFDGTISSVAEADFHGSELLESDSQSSQEEECAIMEEAPKEKLPKKAAFKLSMLSAMTGSSHASSRHSVCMFGSTNDRKAKPYRPVSKTPGPMLNTPFRTPKSVRRGRRPPPDEVEDRILGTPDYLAPELLMQKKHGAEVDWWSLGVCMFEFLTGVPPFNDETQELVFQNILNRDVPWPEDVEALSEHSQEVINGLLTFDPENRFKANELKNHTLFMDIDWDTLHKREMPFVPSPDDDCDTTYFDPRNKIQNLKVSALITHEHE